MHEFQVIVTKYDWMPGSIIRRICKKCGFMYTLNYDPMGISNWYKDCIEDTLENVCKE